MDSNATLTERDPERLLDSINKSIFVKALLMSTVVHLIFVLGSSFSLYKDWAEYGISSEDNGFHTPSKIKAIKRNMAEQKEEEERQQKLEERLEQQRAEAAEAEANATPEAEAPAEPEGNAGDETPKPPEIEPMEPKGSFSLDDVPGLGL